MTNHYTEQMRRKDEHVGHATQQYHAQAHPDLDQTRFVHHPLPELDVADISLQSSIANIPTEVPFYINAMTGGSPKTTLLNQRLAQIAHHTGLAMATGSMSIAMKDPSTAASFTIIRKENPTGILFANLGAHYEVEAAKRAVDLIEADGLQLHLNTAQELIMPEGDRNFSTWLRNIEAIVTALSVPVIVKEVGFGFSQENIRQLENIGVQSIDISGVGGTNFAKIEQARRKGPSFSDWFDWGQSTVISLLEAQGFSGEILASGGIHTPMDMAKCIALGANAVGLSGEFLHLARKEDSVPDAIAVVTAWKEELAFLYALLGVHSTTQLQQQTNIVLPPSVAHWCEARGINWKSFATRKAEL